jgi:hypothetical protein
VFKGGFDRAGVPVLSSAQINQQMQGLFIKTYFYQKCQAEALEAPSSLALRQAQCDSFDRLGGIPLGGIPLGGIPLGGIPLGGIPLSHRGTV